MTAETRQQFLRRVDETNTPHEQALFVALKHLELIAEGAGNAQRLARQCLQSIDTQLQNR